ncbi:MAG TPA: nucleotide exchange factor GrpE [Acidimicrobiia bacterium]|nr:nucleotide exchange factor GrpE [Acidimicrobiia bacterium]
MADQASPTTDAPVGEPDPQLLRVLADLDNLRKRYERRLAAEAAAERGRVVASWLPIVDDLERALEQSKGEGGAPTAALGEGLRAVYEHALAVLDRLGFARFDDVGRAFDPARHEAVATVAADEAPGTVTAAVRPGYETPHEVVRPARVVVARPSG